MFVILTSLLRESKIATADCAILDDWNQVLIKRAVTSAQAIWWRPLEKSVVNEKISCDLQAIFKWWWELIPHQDTTSLPYERNRKLSCLSMGHWLWDRMWTKLCRWNGYVSYGLGADNEEEFSPSLSDRAPVTGIWNLAQSISDPRAEISGILVIVRRSSTTSTSTTYWFQYFCCFELLVFRFPRAQIFPLEVFT